MVLGLVALIIIAALRMPKAAKPHVEIDGPRPVATPQELADRAKNSTKLIAAARSANHPGIILRFACQVPIGSPQYNASINEIHRAERIFDRTIMAAARSIIAKELQDRYFRQG